MMIRPLSPPLKAGGKLSGVEALRGIAAILVVAFHTSSIMSGVHSFGAPPFGQFWQFGRAGVDFFFVLSGFIITFVHFRDVGHAEVFPAFWRKRLLRIYPTWWIVAGLYGALLFLSPTQDRAEQNWAHEIASFLLLPETVDPVLGVGWSLRHELLFYGLFSVLLLNRHAGIAVLAAWSAGILANAAVQVATGSTLFTGIANVWLFRGFNMQFFFGIGTAILVRRGVGRHWRLAALLGAAGFLGTGMLESYTQPVMHEWPVRHIGYALSAALGLYGVASLDRAGLSRVPGLLLRLGAASYSIYLLYIPVLLVAEWALRPVRELVPIPPELAFAGLAAIAVAAGTVFSEAVEQPLLRAGRRPRHPCPEPKPSL